MVSMSYTWIVWATSLAAYLWEIHLLKGTELGGSVPGQDTLKKELGKFMNLCKARTWNQPPLSRGI